MREEGQKNQTLRLDVWYLEGDNATRRDLETVEAEVVFLCREQSGQWPIGQTEIHFHPSKSRHKEYATRIFEALQNNELAHASRNPRIVIPERNNR
jgi:hypothetical protein